MKHETFSHEWEYISWNMDSDLDSLLNFGCQTRMRFGIHCAKSRSTFNAHRSIESSREHFFTLCRTRDEDKRKCVRETTNPSTVFIWIPFANRYIARNRERSKHFARFASPCTHSIVKQSNTPRYRTFAVLHNHKFQLPKTKNQV